MLDAGHYRLDHASGSVSIGAGTVWCVPPGCRHRHAVDGRDAVHTTHLHLIVRRPDGGDVLAGLGAPRFFPGATDGPLGRALRAAVHAPAGDDLASGLQRLSALAALAGAVVSALGRDLVEVSADPGLAAAFAWAEANLHLPLTRGELAERAGLSPSRFHARCLQATGAAPMAWVRRRRLERAAELLAGSDLGMAEVARRVGFCDVFHLNKRFRACYGQPPTQFRRRSREV